MAKEVCVRLKVTSDKCELLEVGDICIEQVSVLSNDLDEVIQEVEIMLEEKYGVSMQFGDDFTIENTDELVVELERNDD